MEWPLYKQELIALGNLDSSTALCTLWTEKERVLEKISPEIKVELDELKSIAGIRTLDEGIHSKFSKII